MFFGCIPGKINCSKGSKSKEYKRKKCLDFLGGAIYREPGSHLQERTLRVIDSDDYIL